MDPDQIELKNLSKSFAYQQIASDIDNCEDREMLKNIASRLQNYIINSKKQCR